MTFERKTSLAVGLLFIATFVTSITAAILYNPVIDATGFFENPSDNSALQWGAVLELLLIVANIGTAVVLYPVVRKRFQIAAIGFVTARVMESVFIGVGILCALSLATLRTTDPESLASSGELLVAMHNWTFVLGPGFVVGIGNGLLLGYMMYSSGLVPKGLAVFGLVGGPAICLTGAAVVLGIVEKGGVAQVVATVPEFIWEAGLGIYLTVKGFKSTSAAASESRPLTEPMAPAFS